MANTNRRNMLRVGLAFAALPSTVLQFGCLPDGNSTSEDMAVSPENRPAGKVEETEPIAKENAMQVQYLEIVTPEVDAVCKTYSQLHGVTFGDADPNLGGARTAPLAGGGMLGVRPPLRDTEEPVVRPYILVQDIQATVNAAAESGAEVAVPPMELPGHGTCAIVIQGGIESGFWQL